MNGTQKLKLSCRRVGIDLRRCRGAIRFLSAIVSTIIAVEAAQPAVNVGRTTLNSHDEHEWLNFLGIEANEFPVNVAEPAYGARLRIDVWEPGAKDKPNYSKTFGPKVTFKEKVPLTCNWKVSFLPPKLEKVIPEDSYPAVLDWSVGRPGKYEEDNPTTWVGRERIDLPMNYLGLEGYTLDVSPAVFNADSFNEPVPIFHYMVTDGYGGRSGKSSAETLKANPQAVHIIGWLVPLLERNAFGDVKGIAPAPAGGGDSPTPAKQLLTSGSPGPEWSATKVDGGVYGSSDLKGKIVVLNFWATWCGHCVAEIPGFVQVQERFRDQGVEFVGMCVDRKLSQEGVGRFLKWHFVQTPMNYSTVMIPDEVQRKFGRIDALPTTYLLDRNGNVAWVREGRVTGAELSTQIQKILGK